MRKRNARTLRARQVVRRHAARRRRGRTHPHPLLGSPSPVAGRNGQVLANGLSLGPEELVL